MDCFADIFAIKNFLAGTPRDAFIHNIPSEGQIARVQIHQYPQGGGYQSKHVDPVSPFARLQTLVMASQIGVDYQLG